MEPCASAFAISQIPICGRTGLKEHEADVKNIYLAAIITKQQDGLSMPLTNSFAIDWCRINRLSCGIVDTWHPSTSSSIDRQGRPPHEELISNHVHCTVTLRVQSTSPTHYVAMQFFFLIH